MGKTSAFLKRYLRKAQKSSIHLSIITLALGVIFVDYMVKDFSNTNIVFAQNSSPTSQEDIKKSDLFLSYLTKIVPPFDNGENQGAGFLTEGNSFLTKPSITNTIISGLPRDKITNYTVSEGETYWTIAYKFELDIDTLLWANNIAVGDIDKIKVGENLTILPVSGLLYTSVEGDTVQGIADSFKVSADKIRSQNKIEGSTILAGTQIVLPGVKKFVPKPAGAVPNYAGDSNYYVGTVASGSGVFGWPINSGARFFSQYFGWVNQWYKHTGVDLDWRNGTDIIAADSGTVVAVGYGWGGGYGNHIIIDHGNGYQTLYAHLSSIDIKTGQNVIRGEHIGVMGSTGMSTGTHLHFEIRQSGVAINPLIYIK
jgi:murein DD-endopeptidase MepM/ murein hydrolase activator NlpD